jgi:hypothetical protein
MTLFIQNKISDYWDKRKITPTHHITKHMNRNQYQELHMRFRLALPKETSPYARVRFLFYP